MTDYPLRYPFKDYGHTAVPITFPEVEVAWDGEECQRCGLAYTVVYRLPDELWEKVTGGQYTLLCPTCCDHLAREKGIYLHWEAQAGVYPTDSPRGVAPRTLMDG